MTVSKASLLLAVRNVAQWGDTDVLPFPLENHWFHDAEDQVVSVLIELDKTFDDWLSNYPLSFDIVLSAVGYAGFRGVTQIDPIWNAYLLALVIELGSEIEKQRLSIADNRVFSYRFAPDRSHYTLRSTSNRENMKSTPSAWSTQGAGFISMRISTIFALRWQARRLSRCSPR